MAYPTLKPNYTWFAPNVSTIKRSTITSINIVDTYTPSSNVTDSWDASLNQDGSIMVYVEGTNLTIAGNGSGKIYANEDASRMFSHDTSERFTNLTTIRDDDGILDTSKCTTFNRMFDRCTSLVSIGGTNNWDTSKVTDTMAMFQMNNALTKLESTNWTFPECLNTRYMFWGCQNIEDIDVSNWAFGKVTIMDNMFAGGGTYDCTTKYKKLDVSNWDMSRAVDVSFMFYACKGPKEIDVSKWNVSSIENFDHMFAHSYLKIGDVSNWRTTSAINMNALFHTTKNEVLDVTNWQVSTVKYFCQMFEHMKVTTEIKGLETWDTSSGVGFDEMFQNSSALIKLNLSSFDTRNAKDGETASVNGHTTATLSNMFNGCTSLEEVIVGPNFSFDGDGTTTSNRGVLPTTTDGYWYSLNGTAYTPSEIPNLTSGVYYASPSLIKQASAKKYISLNALKHYHEKSKTMIENTLEDKVNYTDLTNYYKKSETDNKLSEYKEMSSIEILSIFE